MAQQPSSSYAVRANFLRKTILVTIVLAVITAILVPVSLTSMPRSSSSSSDSASGADGPISDAAILPVGPARAVFPTATTSSNSTSSSPPLTTAVVPISIADPNIYFTPFNWFSVAPFSSSPPPSPASLDGAYRQTTCVGAYFRFKVVGARQAWIAFDQTDAPTSDYMSLRWYIDTDPTNLAQFSASTATPTFASSSSSSSAVSNATGLLTGVWYLPSSLTTMTVANRTYTVAALPTFDPYVSHTIFVVVRSSDPSFDRWQTPQSRARVVTLLVDAVSPSALAPIAAARFTTLLYSDGVGEGLNTLSASGTVLDNSDVSRAFWFEMARRLNTDVSAVAYQRQGYTIGGLGNVPMLVQNLLVDPSRDGIASMPGWSYFDQTNPRVNVSASPSVFMSPVDCIIVTHGAWDAINALANPSVLITNVYNTIAALRQAAKSATTNIVIVTPFGGHSAGLILKAFDSYKAATGDARVTMLDISPLVSMGLNQYGTAMPGMSYDGLHPAAERSSTIGQQLAKQLKALYA